MENYDLQLKPGGVPLVIHTSQFDTAREYTFTPYYGDEKYPYQSGARIVAEATKPDGFVVIESATYKTDGTIYYKPSEALTQAAGDGRLKFRIVTSSELTLASIQITLAVDKAGIEPAAKLSESDVQILENDIVKLAGYVSAAATSASNAKTSASTASSKASAAATSASNAKTSETNAASSKTAAASSASAAKTSETNANTYKNNAASSASAAKTSETNAASSKTAAASSASAAKTSETNAKTSETNAKSYAEQAAKSAAATKGVGSINGLNGVLTITIDDQGNISLTSN